MRFHLAAHCIKMQSWHRLPCDSSTFNVNVLLPAGQSFRWKRVNEGEEQSKSQTQSPCKVKSEPQTEPQSPQKADSKSNPTWVGVFNRKVWFVRQETNEILYQVYTGDKKPSKIHLTSHADELREYLQIDYPIVKLLESCKQRDTNFEKVDPRFLRTRVLRIEALEALFSFILSSCNNIKRIQQLVEKLCNNYGDEICELNGERYFAFPTAKRLTSGNVEAKLRELGLGYRAKYIAEASRQIDSEGELEFISRIRQLEYADAQRELRSLPGVGAKVADCALLYGFARLEAVPLDTHMIAVARHRYPALFSKLVGPTGKRKRSGFDGQSAKVTLGENQYTTIANGFRELWGEHAGVAQAIMFAAELKNVD